MMKTQKLSYLAVNSLMISVVVFILIPLNLVAHNTADFNGLSYAEYFSYGAIFTICSSLVIFIIFGIASLISTKISYQALTAILGYLVICGLYVSIRSGLLDGANPLKISYLHFSLALLVTVLGTVFFEKKFRVLIWIGLIVATLTTIIGLMGLPTSSYKNALNNGFLNVSTDQKNIFVISFDGLEADSVKTILDSNEDLKKEFDGFTNFSHVTAVAPFTLLSILTTKLGYIPNTNINNETLIKDYSKDFITNTLHNMNYQVSTYAAFNYGESKKTITIHDLNIAPQNINFYQLALKDSLQKYLPVYLNQSTMHINMIIKMIDSVMRKPQNNSILYKITANDPDNMSHAKTDMIHFDYFVDHLQPVVGKNTAHFHHYVFTHNPYAFDGNCTYRIISTVRQNKQSNLQETECAIKEFIKFLEKLKTIHAFDNSLIIFASDHGYECQYNTNLAAGAYKISQRWCLSRYQPLLMIKPFAAKQAMKERKFEASLVDISKTICETVADNSINCKQYKGVNLLGIQPKDIAIERDIFVTKHAVDEDAREYNDFDIVNIGRQKTIAEYFGINATDTGIAPLVIFAQNLPSAINGDVYLSGRQALPGKHSTGFLTYGPYLDLPPGRYSVALTFKSSASKNDIVGAWDITTNNGQIIIEKGELTGTAGKIKNLILPFSLKTSTNRLEFRTFFSGTYDLFIEKIIIQKTQFRGVYTPRN